MKNYLTEDKRVWEIEKFLSEEELSMLDSHIEKTEWVTQEGWSNPLWFNNTSVFPDPSFIIDKVSAATDHAYSWNSIGIIMRIPIGGGLNSHVDNYNDPKSGEKNNFMSETLYLNDNYEGGELYYEYLKIDYKPKRGSIVFHPGFENIYKHGVRKVTGGSDRYAMGLVGKSLT
jgi:hypothetical protein